MSTSKILVLQVDDAQDLNKARIRALNNREFECVAVSSAAEAITAIVARAQPESRQFDIVITDLQMPGEDGIDVVIAARRHNIAVILNSDVATTKEGLATSLALRKVSIPDGTHLASKTELHTSSQLREMILNILQNKNFTE